MAILYLCVHVSVDTLSSCKAPGITLDIQISTFGHGDLYSGMQRDRWKGLLELIPKASDFSFPSSSFEKENGFSLL